MSFTIVKESPDPGIGHEHTSLHIRAVISTRSELEELITKLNRRLETDFAQEEKTSEHRNPAALPAITDRT